MGVGVGGPGKNVRLLCVLCARRSSLALTTCTHADVTPGDLLLHLPHADCYARRSFLA